MHNAEKASVETRLAASETGQVPSLPVSGKGTTSVVPMSLTVCPRFSARGVLLALADLTASLL